MGYRGKKETDEEWIQKDVTATIRKSVLRAEGTNRANDKTNIIR